MPLQRFHDRQTDASIDTVHLQNAVLCVDCETVSDTRRDVCPTCGSHSLLSLAGMLGGSVLDFKANRLEKQKLTLFDLHVVIELRQMEGREVGPAIENISRAIGPKLGRGSASLHVTVEPMSQGWQEKRAA